jgi:mRNA-degrading endonuclease RelE of RelBE toxin-antitoxin system
MIHFYTVHFPNLPSGLIVATQLPQIEFKETADVIVSVSGLQRYTVGEYRLITVANFLDKNGNNIATKEINAAYTMLPAGPSYATNMAENFLNIFEQIIALGSALQRYSGSNCRFISYYQLFKSNGEYINTVNVDKTFTNLPSGLIVATQLPQIEFKETADVIVSVSGLQRYTVGEYRLITVANFLDKNGNNIATKEINAAYTMLPSSSYGVNNYKQLITIFKDSIVIGSGIHQYNQHLYKVVLHFDIFDKNGVEVHAIRLAREISYPFTLTTYQQIGSIELLKSSNCFIVRTAFSRTSSPIFFSEYLLNEKFCTKTPLFLATDVSSDVSISPSASRDVSVSTDVSSDVSISPSASRDVSVSTDVSSDVSILPSASSDVSISPSASRDVSVSTDVSSDVSISPSASSESSISTDVSSSVSISPSASSESSISTDVSSSVLTNIDPLYEASQNTNLTVGNEQEIKDNDSINYNIIIGISVGIGIVVSVGLGYLIARNYNDINIAGGEGIKDQEIFTEV